MRRSIARVQGFRGFTLVELLVVITIIGILVSMLLPAIQSAREAGRRAMCMNNLKQMSAGCLHHEEAQGWLPTGGWGWNWAGDPDRGFGVHQPGGWHYNILPYIDQQALHDQGSDPANDLNPSTLKLNGQTATQQTPLPTFTCPTRHACMTQPYVHGNSFYNTNIPGTSVIARSDYAGNGGDQGGGSAYNAGPGSLSAGDALPPGANSPDTFGGTGLDLPNAQVRMAQISDGASNTYLIGERFLDADFYLTGYECANDQGWDQGYDFDSVRWTGNSVFVAPSSYNPNPPIQDFPGGGNCDTAFGSAHAVFHMAFCDGSIKPINFAISGNLHQLLGNRADRQPIDMTQLQ